MLLMYRLRTAGEPLDDFKAINRELAEFNKELSERPQIVVANKCDSASEEAIGEVC